MRPSHAGINGEDEVLRFPLSKLSPTQYFGWGLVSLWAMLTSLIWSIAQPRISQDEQTELAQAADSIGNMALAIEQSVSRTSSEIDRILKYIRTIRTAAETLFPGKISAPSEFASNKLVAQIAIMNKDGMMLTSTAMPYPKPLVKFERSGALSSPPSLGVG